MTSITKIILLSIFLSSCAAKYKITEENRKAALLTEHYGILNQDQINYIAWRWGTFPLWQDSHGYWVCPKTKDISFKCFSLGLDDGEKIYKSDPQMKFMADGRNYDLGYVHGIESTICQNWIAQWRSLLKNQDMACIAFSNIGNKKDPKNIDGIWRATATKTGCHDDGRNYCDPSAYKKYGFPNVPFEEALGKIRKEYESD